MIQTLKPKVDHYPDHSYARDKKPLPAKPASTGGMNKKQHQRLTSSFSSQSSLTSSSPATPISPNSPVSNRFYSSSGSLFSIGSDQLLDHSHLKPGNNAELLSYSKTINMYRENAKKTNDLDIQCDFAIFLVESAKQLLQKHEDEDERDRTQNAEEPNEDDTMRRSYLWEAEKILKQVAMRGHSESQYYLANMYASGLLTKSAKPDIDKAFPLFVQAAKHHHPDASYRTAKCYEEGLGTRKDKGKAVQFYRKAATLNHPGAMYRLGLAQLHGELGLSRNVRDGHKWLKRSAEAATPQYPHALHELAGLHEKGNAIVFVDHAYCVTLYNEAAALRYAPSAFRLGECYEFGKLGCDPDPALSIQYYAIAAEQGHPDACFALTAWYLVGAPNVLEPSDEQAYAWACRAALSGHARAEYAVGYFCEVGIGVAKNPDQAMTWYQKAAEHGDRRAVQRLQSKAPLDAFSLRPPSCSSQSQRSSKRFSKFSMPSPKSFWRKMAIKQ